jgi:hypothetical protein
MAKVSAPLLSFGASGQIAKTMVASKWKGIKYMRQHVIPANPNTVAQQAARGLFAELREMWKLAPAVLAAPWDAFALGRPLTGMNKFVGENMRVLNGEADFNNMIFSPGAKGGTPPMTFAATTGAGSGEVDATFTTPTPPTGWTLAGIAAAAFNDQVPGGIFTGPLVADFEAAPTLVVTLTGLGAAEACQVGGWLVWTKPDGSTAYSVGLTDQATSGA